MLCIGSLLRPPPNINQALSMDDADRLDSTHPLIEAVRDTRVALFLGAGASRGARDHNGHDVPDAAELGRRIADKFLGGGYRDADFRTIYDFACSHRSGREVQQFVFETLDPFYPGEHHLLIPTFSWSSIFTTNYDVVIERAYQLQKDATQHPLPFATDAQAREAFPGPNDISYYKLHGCITQYRSTSPPLIASTEQIIRADSGRAGLFDRFLETAKTHSCLFVGYSFQDFNMRKLLDEIVKDGDDRSVHYILNKTIEEIEGDYWTHRRFRPIRGTFAQLLASLSRAIPLQQRKLQAIAASMRTSPFTRWISVKNGKETDGLVRYVSTHCPIVTSAIDPKPADPKSFYRGDSEA
jgi:hypothetical protein